MFFSLVVMNTLLIVSTAWLSIYYWQQGTMSVGSIAIANSLILRLNQMSGWILRTISALFESIGTVQNGIETISVDNVVIDSPNASELTVANASVEFDAVQFRYSGADDNSDPASVLQTKAPQDLSHDNAAVNRAVTTQVIKDLTFSVAAGEKIGVVGRSGAGKSTLVNLSLIHI